MTVRVTAQHLTNGRRENHFCNPIALALHATQDRFATVTQNKVHLLSGVFEMPQAAKDWLVAFNSARSASPFTFEVGP